MTEREGSSLLAGRRRLALERGRVLRLLSAMEILEAGREAEELSQREGERALCSNACLLARALEQGGRPVFEDGEAVLRGMTTEEIRSLAGQWVTFNWGENPSPEDGEERVEELKKGWSTRLMNACSGVCSALFGPFQPNGGPER